MEANVALVARGFYVVAVMLGLPSALGTLVFSVLSLLAWWQRPAPGAAVDPKASESLVNVVVVMASWMGRILSGLLGLAEGLLHVMAAVSVAGLAVAALIFSRAAAWKTGPCGPALPLAFCCFSSCWSAPYRHSPRVWGCSVCPPWRALFYLATRFG